MGLRIAGLALAVAASAWATGTACTYNTIDLTCQTFATGSGAVNLGTYASPIGAAYQLVLQDIGGGTAGIFAFLPGGEGGPVVGATQGTLGSETGTFQAYVPGAATNGAFANLAPFMYFGVYPNGSDPSNFSDPYALVIVDNSGFNQFTNDAWYTDGIGPNSTVHIVLFDWTAAAAGITNPDWLSCCSDLPTLSQLDSTVIPGVGTWGGLLLDEAVVQVGDWGGSGGPYTAYINGFAVTPEPGTAILFLLSVPLLFVGRRYVRRP